MKKIFCMLIAVIMITSAAAVFAEEDIKIHINGNYLETPVAPMIVNDRTMVPFRVIFEALDMNVKWNEKYQKVHGYNDTTNVILTIGSNKMIVDTDIIEIDVAPFISNGHTLVPVRAITEALKCEVGWDGENRVVIIETKDYEGAGYVAPEKNPEQTPENTVPNTPYVDDTPAYINKNDPEMANKAMEYINQKRAEYGLEELIVDQNISKVALGHCVDMAENDYISHESPSGTTPFERLDMAGIYYNSACEILASGFNNSTDVVDSWLNSSNLKTSILSSEFTHIGLGYWLGGPNGTYWTLLLVQR